MGAEFDAVILGMGPGGEVAAGKLLGAGLKVAVVECELVGGECAYWACIPSKTLLRPTELFSESRRAAGVGGTRLDWADAAKYRDTMVRHLDDGAQVDSYRDQGATVVKGEARVTGPGRVQVGDREITARHIIVATGAEPRLPDIPGLDSAATWTNRDTYTATELPRRAVVVGGSAVGIETATFLASFGVATTLVHRGTSLLGREEPRVGELVLQHLAAAGVDIRLGCSPAGARRDGADTLLELEGQGREARGATIRTDVVVLATGRSPRTAGLGLDSAGVVLGKHGEVAVDENCRAAEGVWAVGDVTGRMPFTHVAKYQARIAADAILGRPREAHYEGIPRVVFGIPEIAAAGLTSAQAAERGLETESVELDAAAEIARPSTYERDPEAHLGLLADTGAKVLVGAWAVGPQAGEWIHYAALAIRAVLPLEVLRDQVAQFPTFHEAYLAALDKFSP